MLTHSTRSDSPASDGAPDVRRAVGDEDVEHLVGDPVRRLEPHERPQRTRLPTGLLERLARRRRDRRLVVLDAAGRDLPAPRVGDEPVPPQQQHAALGIAHDGARRVARHADDVMLEALAVGDLDVDEHEAHPLALVEAPLAVHRPSHAQHCTSRVRLAEPAAPTQGAG